MTGFEQSLFPVGVGCVFEQLIPPFVSGTTRQSVNDVIGFGGVLDIIITIIILLTMFFQSYFVHDQLNPFLGRRNAETREVRPFETRQLIDSSEHMSPATYLVN